MNNDLQQGIDDGLYKSLTPSRGGVVETQDLARYVDLQAQYGIADMKMGVHPNGCNCSYC